MIISLECGCNIRLEKKRFVDRTPIPRCEDYETSCSYHYTVTRFFCEMHQLTTKLNCKCTTSLYSDTLTIERNSQYCHTDIPIEGRAWVGIPFFKSCVDVDSIMRVLMKGTIYGSMKYKLHSTIENKCGCVFTPKRLDYATETKNGVWVSEDATGVISFDDSYPNSLLKLFASHCKQVYDQNLRNAVENENGRGY